MRVLIACKNWTDSDYCPEGADAVRAEPPGMDFKRSLPVIGFHLSCLLVFWVGFSWFAFWTAVVSYYVRIFSITAFHHRYFSHRSFSTSRFAQFLFAAFASSAVQRGSLWWASKHRFHHKHSDEEIDDHSPRLHGFWWSQIAWIMSRRSKPTDYSLIPDFAKYPELVWLNRFDQVVPLIVGLSLYFLGAWLESAAPGLHTTGGQLLVWGFLVGTVAVWHGIGTINSAAHLMGKRRFATDDNSRNSLLLTLLTLGEGWHNNHHRYQNSAKVGFYWWEFDPTYYALKAMSWTGIIWDLKPVPASVLAEGRDADRKQALTATAGAAAE